MRARTIENKGRKVTDMGKISVEGIPESMLKTLYARAKESKKATKFIYCEKSIEIVGNLDYDFTAVEREYYLGKGAIARSILLDKMVGDYIQKNPNATIVNIACGADTRFFRVDNGKIRWYNLDLPVTIEARKRLMDEGDRVFYIPKSALDESWAEDVEADGPVLIIAEALSMYLTKQDVQKIFKIIRKRFEQADIFMEITMPYVVDHAREGQGENNRPKYSFGVKSSKKLAEMATGFQAVKDVSLLAGLKKMYPSYHIMQFMPAMRRMSNKIAVLKRSFSD